MWNCKLKIGSEFRNQVASSPVKPGVFGETSFGGTCKEERNVVDFPFSSPSSLSNPTE